MLEIFKRIGLASGVATVLVLLITAIPVYYQFKYTTQQNERIAVLEKKVADLETNK